LLTSFDTEVAAVKADANLDSAQKALLLVGIAVGYHSAQLWDNYCTNGGYIVGG